MRPLLLFILSFICGIVLANNIINISHTLVMVIIIIIIGFYMLTKLKFRKLILTGCCIFMLLGSVELILVNNHLEKFFPKNNKIYRMKGTVIDLNKTIDSKDYEYLVKIEQINNIKYNKIVKSKVMLKVRKNYKLRYGDDITFNGDIKIPQNKNNPGSFDNKNYCYGIGVSALVYGNYIKINSRGEGNPLIDLGFRAKKKILRIINKEYKDEQVAILAGMLIGDDTYLTDRLQEDFQKTGLSHLLVASGANIIFVITPFMFIFKKIHLSRKKSGILMIIILFIYLTITGFDPSIVRAFIMAVILLISQIIKKDYDISTSIAFAAFVMLIQNPFMLYNIGFQLSYIATLSIVIFYEPIYNKFEFLKCPKIIKDVIVVTIAVQIGVLPVSIFYFGKVSLIALLANMLIIPMIEVLMVIGFLSVILSYLNIILDNFFILISKIILDIIIFIASKSSMLKYATIDFGIELVEVVLLVYLGICLFIYVEFKNKKSVLVAIALVIVLLNQAQYFVEDNYLKFCFFDVGQGDSIYFETKNKKVLIDAGARIQTKDYTMNFGEKVVAPYLKSRNIKDLDLVAFTHSHNDHVGGIPYILKNFNVAKVMYSLNTDFNKDLINSIKSSRIDSYIIDNSNTILLDKDIKIDVLSPDPNSIDENDNNNSLVLKVTYNGFKFLLCGDIEEEIENKLLEDKADLRADVIKIAHHGSDTSSSMNFLNEVNPKIAIISVGKNNFGHPSTNVINRLRKMDIKIYRTDESGAIEMLVKKNEMFIKKMKK